MILQKLADCSNVKNYAMNKQGSRMERNPDLESKILGSSAALCQKKMIQKLEVRRKEGNMSFQCHIGAQAHPRIIAYGIYI